MTSDIRVGKEGSKITLKSDVIDKASRSKMAKKCGTSLMDVSIGCVVLI